MGVVLIVLERRCGFEARIKHPRVLFKNLLLNVEAALCQKHKANRAFGWYRSYSHGTMEEC